MRISKRHAHEIEQTMVFVCFPPKHGIEGTLGDHQLAYAVALGKPVIVWMPDGPRPVPERLADYQHTIACTDDEIMMAMTPYLGEPGETVYIADGDAV